MYVVGCGCFMVCYVISVCGKLGSVVGMDFDYDVVVNNLIDGD